MPCVRDRVASIVVCEQALPHTDPSYEARPSCQFDGYQTLLIGLSNIFDSTPEC